MSANLSLGVSSQRPMQQPEFRSLYHAHSRRIYNYLLWLTQNREASDDIMQSVFIKVWNQGAVPQREEEQVAWLITIARNACMDFFRSSRRYSRLCQAVGEGYEAVRDQEPEDAGVWDMLRDLSTEERSIIYLHIKIGYNYREIGRILNMQENAVRVRAFRALKRLRTNLERGQK